ncbi:MAG TPA: oligosaccharide flippase family protein [Pyrinomonadaceae bacterium]|nr:oligosaccharide flippase family protein [Pyrinomonadaceae bacterium]
MSSEETQVKSPSLTSQGAWLLFAKVIGFGLSFALPLITVRTLSKGEIGTYQQVFLVIVFLSGILPFGVSMSAFYYLAREKTLKRFYIFNILLFNFVMGGLACAFLNFYPQVLGNVFKSAEMTQFAPQIGVVIWLWVFSSFFETVAIANQEARIATIFIISAQLTKAIFMITAVLAFGTVEAMLTAANIQAILETTALFIYLNSRFNGFWHSFRKDLFIAQLRYAIPFGLMGILWTFQADIHNWFIGYRFSEEEFATYRVGCFELPLLFLLQESISSVMIPRMSQLHSEGNYREMINLTVRAMEKLSLAYFPTFVFFFITATTFITTLFTQKFADSVPIFMINITLLPFAAFILDPVTRAFSSLGKYILKVRIVLVILLLATLYYGVQHFDLRQMAMIVVATALIDRCASTIKIWKTVGVKWEDLFLLKNVWKTGLVTILAGIPTFFFYQQIKQFTPNFSQQIGGFLHQIAVSFFKIQKDSLVEMANGFLILGLTGIVFATLYLLGIYFFGIIRDEEKEFIRSKLSVIGKIFGWSSAPKKETEILL